MIPTSTLSCNLKIARFFLYKFLDVAARPVDFLAKTISSRIIVRKNLYRKEAATAEIATNEANNVFLNVADEAPIIWEAVFGKFFPLSVKSPSSTGANVQASPSSSFRIVFTVSVFRKVFGPAVTSTKARASRRAAKINVELLIMMNVYS